MVAVTLAIELLLMNVIGIFIRKTGIIDKKFTSQLSSVLMNFCIPCLIFYSVSHSAAFSLDALVNCIVIIGLGAFAIIFSLVLGHIIYVKSGKSGGGRITRYGLTFCHYSFMGIPVMATLFGEMGTFYYTFFIIPVRIAYYSMSESLMTPANLQGAKMGIGKVLKKTFLSPQMIALFLGLIFWIGGLKLPEALEYCVKSLNTISSPLALLMCGMVIGESNFKALLNPSYLKLPILRTVIMPAIMFGFAKLFMFLGVDPIFCSIMVIYSALPVASLMTVYTVKYDPDPNNHMYSAGTSVISVLMSAVTIPIFYMLLGI